MSTHPSTRIVSWMLFMIAAALAVVVLYRAASSHMPRTAWAQSAANGYGIYDFPSSTIPIPPGDAGSISGPYFLGTHTTVSFDYVRISSPTDSERVQIAQSVIMSDGSQRTYTGGIWNVGPTTTAMCRLGSGPVFQCAKTAWTHFNCAVGTQVQCKSSGQWPTWEVQRNHLMRLALAMEFDDACKFTHSNCPVPYRIYWNFDGDGVSPSYHHGGVMVPREFVIGGSWNPPAPYPVSVRIGYHGLNSTDPGFGDRVHLRFEDNAYYYTMRGPTAGRIYCSSSTGCSGGLEEWMSSPANVVDWPSLRLRVRGPVQIIPSSGSGQPFDLCLNDVPWGACAVPTSTPTRTATATASATAQCDPCKWPANLNEDCFTQRWVPGKTILGGTPTSILWYLDADTFAPPATWTPVASGTHVAPTPDTSLWVARNSTPAAWHQEAMEATGAWNGVVPAIFEEAASRSAADILIVGVKDEVWCGQLRRQEDAYAEWDPYGDSLPPELGGAAFDAYGVTAGDCCPGDVGPYYFYQEQQSGVVRVHLASGHGPTPTVPALQAAYSFDEDWSPASPWLVPAMVVLAHELGHALLGPYHQVGCPNPPTPWPVMCTNYLSSPKPSAGHVTLDMLYDDLRAALECQLRYPTNWVKATPAPGQATPMPDACKRSEGIGIPTATFVPTSTTCPSATPH